MFDFEVVGIVRGSYTKKDTGAVKPFTRIYCTYPLDDAKYSSCSVSGVGTDVFFVPSIIDDLQIGDLVIPIYNKYGRCVDIKIL